MEVNPETCSVHKIRYLRFDYEHVSADTLNTGKMIPLAINSPTADVSTQ
jgi:hypothetical protein